MEINALYGSSKRVKSSAEIRENDIDSYIIYESFSNSIRDKYA